MVFSYFGSAIKRLGAPGPAWWPAPGTSRGQSPPGRRLQTGRADRLPRELWKYDSGRRESWQRSLASHRLIMSAPRDRLRLNRAGSAHPPEQTSQDAVTADSVPEGAHHIPAQEAAQAPNPIDQPRPETAVNGNRKLTGWRQRPSTPGSGTPPRRGHRGCCWSWWPSRHPAVVEPERDVVVGQRPRLGGGRRRLRTRSSRGAVGSRAGAVEAASLHRQSAA